MEIVLFIIIMWVFMGVLGGWIATQKGRQPAEGFVLGFVVGPLGVLVEALLPTLDAEVPRKPSRSSDEPETLLSSSSVMGDDLDVQDVLGLPPDPQAARSHEDFLKSLRIPE